MISLKKLNSEEEIAQILPHYESTFPADERRDRDDFLSLSENTSVDILGILEDEISIGYAVVWNLNSFYFLEHFEVFKEFRNRKFGASVLKILTQTYPKMILESEPSDFNEIAQRRIAFYERNGFHIIEKHYLQPSYGEGKNSMELYLMANFQNHEIPESIAIIHQNVYRFLHENN